MYIYTLQYWKLYTSYDKRQKHCIKKKSHQQPQQKVSIITSSNEIDKI